MDDWSLPKPRLALLLEHFAAVEDVREPWRVAYPLREVLFLAVCATIANCDDYEDIVDWGEANLKFLRGFSDYHFGIPCADWLRSLMNREGKKARMRPILPERLFLVGQDFILDFSPPSNPQRVSAEKKVGMKFNAASPYPEGGALIVGPKGSIAAIP